MEIVNVQNSNPATLKISGVIKTNKIFYDVLLYDTVTKKIQRSKQNFSSMQAFMEKKLWEYAPVYAIWNDTINYVSLDTKLNWVDTQTSVYMYFLNTKYGRNYREKSPFEHLYQDIVKNDKAGVDDNILFFCITAKNHPMCLLKCNILVARLAKCLTQILDSVS